VTGADQIKLTVNQKNEITGVKRETKTRPGCCRISDN